VELRPLPAKMSDNWVRNPALKRRGL